MKIEFQETSPTNEVDQTSCETTFLSSSVNHDQWKQLFLVLKINQDYFSIAVTIGACNIRFGRFLFLVFNSSEQRKKIYEDTDSSRFFDWLKHIIALGSITTDTIKSSTFWCRLLSSHNLILKEWRRFPFISRGILRKYQLFIFLFNFRKKKFVNKPVKIVVLIQFIKVELFSTSNIEFNTSSYVHLGRENCLTSIFVCEISLKLLSSLVNSRVIHFDCWFEENTNVEHVGSFIGKTEKQKTFDNNNNRW